MQNTEYEIQVYDYGLRKIVFTAKVSSGANMASEISYWERQYPSLDGYTITCIPMEVL